MKQFYLATGILLALLFLSGCSSDFSSGGAREKTEKLFQKELAKDNVHNAFLQVCSPSKEIEWNFVGGQFQNGEAVTAANPFYTASIGKTFTATAIAVLAEEGRLKFNDKIAQFLPDSIVKKLHVFERKDYSNQITIAQLLQHTSGLPDYFEGETIDNSPNVMEILFANPEKFWNPHETIRFTKERMQPLFVPGTDYHYTDTEYVLLGLIIEKLSGVSLHEFFRMHFFEPLEMENTSMLLRSEPLEKTARMAEVYVGEIEASGMKSLSADWAGGGLVSTASDLNKFQQALFSGEIISNETLTEIQNWIPETRGMEYGYGLRKISFKKLFPALPDLEVVGHSGITGSFMFYCPELDVYLAGTLNQTKDVKSSVALMVKVLSVIRKMKESKSGN